MFWDRFYNLCLDQKTKPNPVAKELNISSGAVTQWKQGVIPKGDILIKIAQYFNVSTDYLLGLTDEKQPFVKDEELTPELQDILIDAMSLPLEKQKMALEYLRFLNNQNNDESEKD